MAVEGNQLKWGVFERAVGGDPWVLPTAFFVSKEQAWVAVEEFCKTGQRTDKINWKNHTEVKWNYDYAEET